MRFIAPVLKGADSLEQFVRDMVRISQTEISLLIT